MNTFTIADTQSDNIEAAQKYSPEDLVSIATKHTLLGYAVAFMVPLGFCLIPLAPQPLTVVVMLAFHVLAMNLCCRLARLLHKSNWLWAVWAGIPLLNLLAFIRITSQAALILRRAGIRPGILGVSRREMQRYGSADPDSPTTTWNSPHRL